MHALVLQPTATTTARLLDERDGALVAEYHRRNEEYHRPWSPIPPEEFFTEDFQRARLAASSQLAAVGREFRFGVFHHERPEYLMGIINLNAVERGVFQNGRFGYSIDVAHAGKGLATAALRVIMRFAFGELELHRLEANIMPRNEPSRRVLLKCGFSMIGYSPRMLMINGVWEDHEMYMVLAEQFSVPDA